MGTVPVWIGSQSRVFATTPEGRSALLRNIKRVTKTGRVAAVTYFPSGIIAYHSHHSDRSWIPTAPVQAKGATHIEIQKLSLKDFLQNLPSITFRNALMRQWFPEGASTLGYTLQGEDVAIKLQQQPPIEGTNSYEIRGVLARPLSFLDGKAVLEFLSNDQFGFGRRLRLYHDGHSGATLGLQHSSRFNSVVCVSCDGVRQRFLYKPNQIRLQTATQYLSSPNSLYAFTSPSNNQKRQLVESLRPDFVLEVNLRRKLESSMLNHGTAYDHGIIGAEIAYSIASKLLMNNRLLIMEPAMRGSDIVSRDGSVAVEARMLAGSKPRTPSYINHEVVPHIKQMIGRLRWGLSKKSFKRGIAVLCLRLEDQRILACVKEA